MTPLADPKAFLRRSALSRRRALDAGALTIPDSVQGVLAARIDLLEPPAKDALLSAAVIGRSFSTAGLAALVGSAAEVRLTNGFGYRGSVMRNRRKRSPS